MDEAAASLGLAEWKELGGACNDMAALWCDGSVVKLGRSVNSGTGTALLTMDKVRATCSTIWLRSSGSSS